MAVPKLPLFSLSWWVGGLIRRKTAQLALTHFKWKLVIVLRGWGTNPITIKLWENPIQNLRSQKELKIEIKTQKLRMISFFFFSRSSLFFLFPPCSALSSPSTEIPSSKHIVTIGHMSNRQRTTYIKTILATIQPNPTHLCSKPTKPKTEKKGRERESADLWWLRERELWERGSRRWSEDGERKWVELKTVFFVVIQKKLIEPYWSQYFI